MLSRLDNDQLTQIYNEVGGNILHKPNYTTMWKDWVRAKKNWTLKGPFTLQKLWFWLTSTINHNYEFLGLWMMVGLVS